MISLDFSDIILIAQEKQSFIHGLDPRTKICLVLAVVTLSMAFFQLFFFLGVIFLIIFLVLSAKVLREWLKALKIILYLIIFIFFVNLIIYGYINAPKPLSLLDLNSWARIFSIGVKYGVLFALRMLIFSGISILFIFTTDLEDFGVALRKMRIPYEFAFIVVATARFIPVLIADIETIMKAKMVKGIEFQRGSLITKIRRYTGLMVPLVIVSLRRSNRLAEAMDARGFRAEKQRTYYSDVNMRVRDWILSSVFLGVLVIGILYKLSISHLFFS